MNAKLVPSNVLPIVTAFCLLLAMVAAPTMAQAEDPLEITIQVSPGTLNLERAGDAVTIHADIAFSIVNQQEVKLYFNENDVDYIVPAACFADDLGYFVARFSMEDIRALDDLVGVLDVGGYNVFVLWGQTLDATVSFWGEDDEVRVVEGGLQAGRGG